MEFDGDYAFLKVKKVSVDGKVSKPFIVSKIDAGRNTGGSQFFVCHSRENTAHLDRNHTCFGKVVDGVDVIDDIREGDKIVKVVITE